MKQITENYVSFEIAKLLKEKGFDEPCIGFYNPIDGCFFESSIRKSWNYDRHGSISVPTHQMALKWLRLCYDIVIDISPNLTLNDVCKGSFMSEIYQYGHIVPEGEFGCNVGDDYTYEQVVEMAIKYVLENLI